MAKPDTHKLTSMKYNTYESIKSHLRPSVSEMERTKLVSKFWSNMIDIVKGKQRFYCSPHLTPAWGLLYMQIG